MVFIIIGTDSFHFSSPPLEMNSANLFRRKSAGNKKCQHYFWDPSDRRMEFFLNRCIKTMWTICGCEKWQECLLAELRGLGFALALCICSLALSLSLENKVGSENQFFFFPSLKHVDPLHSEWVGMSLIEPPWKKKKKPRKALVGGSPCGHRCARWPSE